MKKKKKIKMISFQCPACKKSRFISEKTIEEINKTKSLGLCASCSTKKTNLYRKQGIKKEDWPMELYSHGCKLTESSSIISKNGNKFIRIGRCKKFTDCKYRDDCCNLAAKHNWMGFKSDMKGYKLLTKEEKMKIYDVNSDHINDIGYLKFNNIFIYK